MILIFGFLLELFIKRKKIINIINYLCNEFGFFKIQFFDEKWLVLGVSIGIKYGDLK